MQDLAALSPPLLLLLGIGIGLVLALGIGLAWRVRYSGEIRRDAVQRSHATIAGRVHEQLLPYLPDFPYNPKDVRFLGSPVDLVVFDGLDAGRLEGIVFVEVKTGRSTLSGRERQVREAVQNRRVAWRELRVELPAMRRAE